MYQLTKEQKIENLKEVRNNLARKMKSLEEQIRHIDSKIQKLERPEVSSSTNPSDPVANMFTKVSH